MVNEFKNDQTICELTLSARPPRQRLSSEVQRCLQRILLGFNRSMTKNDPPKNHACNPTTTHSCPGQERKTWHVIALPMCFIVTWSETLSLVFCCNSLMLKFHLVGCFEKNHPWSCSGCSLLLAERSFEKEMLQSDKARKYRTVTWSKKKHFNNTVCFHDILLLVWETGFFSHSTFS